MIRFSRKILPFFYLLAVVACMAGPQGPDLSGESGNPGALGSSGPNQPGGAEGENPATRPTPGFTEVEMKPATSTTLPAPASFLKSLAISTSPLIDVHEIRMFVRDLNLDDAVSAGLEYPGKFLFRLIDGDLIVDESLPPLGLASVPQGSYGKLDLSFELLDAGEIPPGAESDPLVTGPLVGHSIVVEGEVGLLNPIDLGALGTLTVVKFRFLSDEIAHLEVTSPAGFDFGPDLNHLFLAFKVKTWLGLSGLVETAVGLLSLPELVDLLTGGVLIIDAPTGDVALAAVQVEANINTSLRVAPSADALFQEGDVQEDSFSLCVANCP